jgi:hypothetical protein
MICSIILINKGKTRINLISSRLTISFFSIFDTQTILEQDKNLFIYSGKLLLTYLIK